jgi:GTP-binding protein Era
MSHKAGFVSIIGKPNVGKSTLMNALIGEKLSITNPKAQTTRHRILGIWNDEGHQIVFSDTPGILDPAYKLQENMMSEVDAAIKDADAILYLVEPEEPFNLPFIDKLNNVAVPVIVVINKVDLNEQIDIAGKISEWKGFMPNAEIIPTSALHKFNVDGLIKVLSGHLPEHPPYYDKEALTDRSVRFFVSEIIRENILRHFKKEIPYSVEVVVDAYKEGKFKDEIAAIIYVERESQKIIVIGQGGRVIKRLGTDSRRAIENFIRKKIRLDLTVKVRKDWRSNEKDLKDFGYQN